MGLRHNFFSFFELAEACRAIRLALTHAAEGSQPMFIVNSRNALNMPAQVLARFMYPDVVVREELSENPSSTGNRPRPSLSKARWGPRL